MTPTAIAPDMKGAASPRGRAGAVSAIAGLGPDFDGVLASLGEGAAAGDDTAGAPSAIGNALSALIASGASGNAGLIATLVDRAAGTGEATKAKSKTSDTSADTSGQASAQAAATFGLVSMLALAPTPAGSGESKPHDAADTARDAEIPVTLQAAPAGTVPVAMSAGSAAIVAGSLDSRAIATKARAEKPSDASDPIATRDIESDGATLQSVSVSTQVAPSASVHAGQLARVNMTTAPPLGLRDATVEVASARTSKTDHPAPDAAAQMPATITTIADAVSDLADAPATASVPSPSPTPTLAPARTLVLQLAPADLGTVAVRLHLTGQTLDVQLSVSDPKTLGLVSRERDTLAARLDDRGYQLNTLVIQGADASTSSTAGSHDPSHNGAAADRDQGADPGRRGPSGQGNRDPGQRSAGNRASPGRDTSADGRGGLFI